MITEVVPPTPPSDWEEGSSALASNVVLGFAGLPSKSPAGTRSGRFTRGMC
jgi:hypothetical protein